MNNGNAANICFRDKIRNEMDKSDDTDSNVMNIFIRIDVNNINPAHRIMDGK